MKTHLLSVVFFALIFSACKKDPYEGVTSNERSIEAITLGGGLVQVGPAVIDREAGTASVKVLMQEGTDLSNVQAVIQSSYRSSISPEGTPVNFAASNNTATYTVTAESGSSREWTVELVPFTETIIGNYSVSNLIVFGGTGPEYGGGAVLAMTDKPWVWPSNGGPDAELDNILSFEFEGVTPEGKTFGRFFNDAGADGQYADFLFVNPQTDVNGFYRTMPKGEGTWERDYSANTVTFKFSDGRTSTGAFASAGTTDLGNDLSKTVLNNAFVFALNGNDDWDNIYSDYDKFVKRPRRFWIDVERRD